MDDMNNRLPEENPQPENGSASDTAENRPAEIPPAGNVPNENNGAEEIPEEKKYNPYGEQSFYVPPQPPNYGPNGNVYYRNGYPQTPPPNPQRYNVPSSFNHGTIPTNNFNGNPPPSGGQTPPPYGQQPPMYGQQPMYGGQQTPPPQQYGQQTPPPQYGQPVPPPQYINPQQRYNGNIPPYNGAPNSVPPYMADGAGVKKGNAGVLIAVISAAVVLLVIIGILMSLSVKDDVNDDKDSVSVSADSETKKPSDSKDKPSDSIVVNIEVKDKPKLEDNYYQADGVRLTTEGVAKMVSPSVCEIICYGEGNLSPVSKGSGIVISEEGYIITNAHVVDNAKGVKTVFTDGTEYKAELVGKDSKTDLAVIRIEAEGLTPAELGNSDQMELGEQVVTIGNPGNLSGTITVGYVSGLHRKVRTDSSKYLMNCIQTDAAVNPGNSGGALVNMYGQVVGIVSSKYVLAEYEGLGFAIEMNEAKPIIEDIISKGYISGRLRIGIEFIGINEVAAAQNGIPSGLLIRSIRDDCDISNTELEVDDIITELNGKKVYNTDTVLEALEGCVPGDTVTAKVYRRSIVSTEEGEEFEISFMLMQDETLD
ncbi:MAG: trypsin-like peptidase domain-containing protein [Oscillospiraceae bacterium]|nr:trypsin-like peptidase domain-containing protein [Oscillospiraceae bacterium]